MLFSEKKELKNFLEMGKPPSRTNYAKPQCDRYECNLSVIILATLVSNIICKTLHRFFATAQLFIVIFCEEIISRVTDRAEAERSRAAFEMASSSRVKWISTRLYRTRPVKPSNKRTARRRLRRHGGSGCVWQASVVPFTCPAGRERRPRRSGVDATFVKYWSDGVSSSQVMRLPTLLSDENNSPLFAQPAVRQLCWVDYTTALLGCRSWQLIDFFVN